MLLDHNKQYLLLNKPRLCSLHFPRRPRSSDGFGLCPPVRAVFTLLAALIIFRPVLILLTNDGDLALHLTHPPFPPPQKPIWLLLTKPLTADHFSELSRGHHPRRRTNPSPAHLDRLSPHFLQNYHPPRAKNRQIRRMMEHFDYRVTSLHRTAIGPIQIGALRPRPIASSYCCGAQVTPNFFLPPPSYGRKISSSVRCMFYIFFPIVLRHSSLSVGKSFHYRC